MALVQLVVVLCLLALSLGKKDMKADFSSSSVSKNPTPQNDTGQQRGENEEKLNRFARWAFNSPTDEFSAVPFPLDEEQENVLYPLEFFNRTGSQMLRAPPPPPLDKIGGGFYTRELSEPEFEGLDSLRGEAFGINRRFTLQHDFIPSHSALKDIRGKRSDTQIVSKLTDKPTAVKRLDKIDRTGFRPANFGGYGRGRKNGYRSFKKSSGSGINTWQKRNFDEIDRSGFNSLKKRNFDEIDRASFHSLGKRNFDEIDRAGFYSLGKRNFDEIDRAGFHSLGRRNFDEIDRAGFHSLGRRNFDEIAKSRFRSLGKRDFDEIDRSGFRDFGKRNFDEIDRSGFRDFGKRSPEESDTQALFGEGGKDFSEAYKNENSQSGKRNFDEIDRSGFRSFIKRSTSEENTKSST